MRVKLRRVHLRVEIAFTIVGPAANFIKILNMFMRLLSLSLALFLLLPAITAVEPPTELEIRSSYIPEDCKIKARSGDRLSVHYV